MHSTLEFKLIVSEDGEKIYSRALSFDEVSSLVSSARDSKENEPLFAVAARHPASAVREYVASKDNLPEDALKLLMYDKAINVLRNLTRSDKFRQFATTAKTPSLSNASARWPTAVHEAGHALVSWLDSRERRAPAFVAATGVRAAIGVMVPAHDAVEQTTRDDTRRDLDHTIRVALAGRAAEVMLLGEQSISAAGAERDLCRVSELATMMFSRWGLSPGIDDHDDPSSNLLVISEDADDVEKARVAGLVRSYLRKQYLAAYAILEQNHALLGRIADALAAHGVLFQEDFERLSV